ncbi:hypothetical protein [Actinomadura harenae]|uniref:DUF3185 family protein n=1 Tax=Actinomadura harenae TaxID=2483351 RepID=A0A3M2LSP4_9ACTN|nr:hypothetical protein [Actinomadura harenae]RMI40417.1 hypothetical protein EBO15_26515 [Actinomadura harenae]
MRVLGVVVAVLGFGSLIAFNGDNDNVGPMSWASGHQPVAGIAVGLLGLVVAGLGFASRSRR